MSMLPGFVKGQSDNLPKIDAISMFTFLGKNPDFTGAELRGAKVERSGRESYGDNAIGYVQVKRENNLCTVIAKVTPEHKITKKAYQVTVTCNEEDEEVLSAECDSCAASLEGCKHAVALLAWLHRRSEEPSVTDVTCYWKKSKLSTVGSSLKFMRGKEIGKQPEELLPKTGSFLSAVLQKSVECGRNDSLLTKYYNDFPTAEKLSIHHFMLEFFQLQNISTINADLFLEFCAANMSAAACDEAAIKTIKQSQTKLWHELRYGRITASKAYESAHCRTFDGCLVESILGASKIQDSLAMKRGRELEKQVLKMVQKKLGFPIENSVFFMNPQFPIMGASPDGISNEYIFEVKCPNSAKTIKKYLCDSEIMPRYFAQVQLQMFLTNRNKGFFCIAKEDFETSQEVVIQSVDLDANYCNDLIEKCTQFWKLAIFPVLEKYK